MTGTARAAAIEDFLATAGWGDAQRTPLAGDASARRYVRLVRQDGGRAILMDAPPATAESVLPFLRIAAHLKALGLSAPDVMAAEPAQGLVLLEDLGDGLYARVAAADPGLEHEIYMAAVDVLLALAEAPLPEGIGHYDAATLGSLAGLSVEWYARHGTGAEAPDAAARDAVVATVRALSARHAGSPEVLALRDFHAENLLWLPERKGVARVGLLDFQDAMACHPAYDLVSLLADARRDVPVAVATAARARYLAGSGADPDAFALAEAALSAQRNLRILGVFARLCVRDGKPGYVALLPRVWRHLEMALAQPELAALRELIHDCLPPPTEAVLERIRRQCAAAPTPQ